MAKKLTDILNRGLTFSQIHFVSFLKSKTDSIIETKSRSQKTTIDFLFRKRIEIFRFPSGIKKFIYCFTFLKMGKIATEWQYQ